jgi:hypothetical protein
MHLPNPLHFPSDLRLYVAIETEANMRTDEGQGKKIALAGIISEMARILADSAAAAAEAEEAINRGERDLAVGALLGIDAAIQAIGPLYAATISLHRSR